MFSGTYNFLFGRVNSYVESKVITNAKNILKPRDFNADPKLMEWFNTEFKASELADHICSMTVDSDGRTLTAKKFHFYKAKSKSPGKAIIYVCGNGEFCIDGIVNLSSLLRDIKIASSKLKKDDSITFFCQDYRGKGFNQKDENENFNDYSLAQDAKDQAALIKKVVELGYAYEDILIIGHSLGSAVALWVMYNLVNEYGDPYSKIKVFSDRGYGNLLDYWLLRPFISDQAVTYKELRQNGLMPPVSLHDIALSLPFCFVYRVENDSVIQEGVSLEKTFSSDEMSGRTSVGQVSHENKYKNLDPHNVIFEGHYLKGMPELKPHHIIAALLYGVPLELNFNFKLPNIPGYKLLSSATQATPDYVVIPAIANDNSTQGIDIQTSSMKIPIAIPPSVVFAEYPDLITRLHNYCLEKAANAINSGKGEAYKRKVSGLTLLSDWTAKQQIDMAVRIMLGLCAQNGPDIFVLKKIATENGPHKTGGLNIIFMDVMGLINAYEQVLRFNEWVAIKPVQHEASIEAVVEELRKSLSIAHS